MMAWTVSWRAQSRCSSTARETQLIGCPPAWITRSRQARWASGEGRVSPAGGDVDGGVHDRDVEGFAGLDRRDGVLDQEVAIHRVDPRQL
jgi:hypothetical protein